LCEPPIFDPLLIERAQSARKLAGESEEEEEVTDKDSGG